jgi:hypothetical protein
MTQTTTASQLIALKSIIRSFDKVLDIPPFYSILWTENIAYPSPDFRTNNDRLNFAQSNLTIDLCSRLRYLEKGQFHQHKTKDPGFPTCIPGEINW